MELIKNNIYNIKLIFENKKYEYIFKFDHFNKGLLYVNGYIQLYDSNIIDYSSEKNNLILDLNYSEFEIVSITEANLNMEKKFNEYIEF